MLWKKAGTMSSWKFSPIHSQSIKPTFFCSPVANSLWRKASIAVGGSSEALSIRDLGVVRQGPYGVDGERAARTAAVPVRHYEAPVGAGADDLREGVLQGKAVAYARKVVAAVYRVEVHVPYVHEREPLEHPVRADKGGDEVRVRVG